MADWTDYKTCPKCWAVILKNEYDKHSCVAQVQDTLLAKEKAKQDKLAKEKAEKISNSKVLKDKSRADKNAIAKELGISRPDLMTAKDLDTAILEKQSEE